MLKALMLKRRIDAKQDELNKLLETEKTLQSRSEEIESAIEETKTDEEMEAVEQEIQSYESELADNEQKKQEILSAIAQLQSELAELENDNPINDEATNEDRKSKGVYEVRSMSNLQIRTAPKNVKALDLLNKEQRTALMEKDEVKAFVNAIRTSAKEKRDIQGGSLTIPVEFLELISENLYRYSRLMDKVRVRNVNGEARQTIGGTVPEAVWTEMCGAINELTITFNQVTVDGYKVAGFIPVCNSLLEDSDIDLSAEIIEMLSEACGLAIDKAILYGKGASSKMPMGIVTRLAETEKPSGYPTNAPAWVDLHTTNIITLDATLTGAEFWSKLILATSATGNRYARGEMFWAMNSKTKAMLQSKAVTFTSTGAIVAGVAETLPIVTGDIVVLEFMADGDIVGGYGDLYLLAQRGALSVEYDRSVQFIQDNTVFKGKQRVDGLPVIAQGFVAININGATPTTAMVFAGDDANNALLNELSLGGETLAPVFDATVTTYTVSATNASDTISATAENKDAKVTIAYNGKNIRNGGTVTYIDGTNPITVTVANGNAKLVYTINVTKA